MKLSIIAEFGQPLAASKVMTYYKVMTGKKPNVITPGYMTNDPGTVQGYLSAFISSANAGGREPEGENQPVWVIKTDIDVNQLQQIDGLIFWNDSNDKIKPGYYGTETSPDDGISNILDVIVVTQPTKVDVIGGYIPVLNYDFKSGKINSYIKTGNAWKFIDDLGNFDDFKSYDYK